MTADARPTTEVQISTDAQGRVTGWNEAAARVFGLPAAQALGQPLPELLRSTLPSTSLPDDVFHQFEDGGPLLIGLLTGSGQVRYLNRPWPEEPGVAGTQEQQGQWLTRIHPDDRAPLLATIRDAWANPRPLCFQYRALRADGRYHWVIGSGAPYAGPDGQATDIIVAATDITELKLAELAAQESESKLRTFIEQSSEGILLLDEEGRIAEWNPAMTAISGLPRDQVLGQPYFDVWLSYQPPPRRTPAERERLRSLFTRAFATGEPLFTGPREARYLHADGTERVVLQSVFPIWTERGFRFGSVNLDVTALKHAEEALEASEQRLELALDSVNDGLWDWNILTDQTYYSPRYYAMLGYRAEEFAATSQAWLDLIHPDDRSLVQEALHAQLRTSSPGHDSYSIEFRILARDGSWRWIHSRGRVVRWTDQGAPARMIGTHTDITARKQAEEERALLEAQLRQAHKMEAMGRLAGGIAHDFNNLLTAIMGYADVCQRSLPPDHPLHSPLNEISKASHSAASLTRQLLAFGRKQVIEPKVVNVNEHLQPMQRMLRRLIGEDVSLRADLQPELGNVRIDGGQFEQSIINLVVNARDALPDGGSILLRTRNREVRPPLVGEPLPPCPPGSYVEVCIIDDGLGMTEEVKAHLFEPFFTTKELGRGTGLGLAMIYGVVTQNNGFIEVESSVDRGTTFRLLFPRVQEQAVPPRTRTNLGFPGGDERIILVEDEPMVLRLAEQVLQLLGYAVRSHASAEDALAALADGPVDAELLVTDVILPGKNGRELAEELQRRQPKLAVLYTSGHVEKVLAPQGVLDAGFFFLPKPYTPQTLAEKVREVLKSRSG